MEYQEQVVIQITTPEQRSEIGGVNKYFVYTIRGKDASGQIDITRRYSDFFLLREILVKRWPGFYVPSLPEKKTIGADDKIFVQSRRRGLEYFLTTLAENQKLWKSQEINIFLRNSTGDSEKLLAPLMKESFEKILIRYRQLFPEFQEKDVVKEANGKILEFNSYLKGSKPILEKLSEMTQRMHELYKRSMEKKFMLFEFLLPDYEKACLLENDQKKKAENLLFLCSKNNGISESLQKFKHLNEYPPVLLIFEEIRRERREIEAFEELLKLRDEFEADRNKAISKMKDIEIDGTKINSGKESFFSKIKKVSKEEQLAVNQKELEKAKSEERNYTIACQIITNIVASIEIDRFKQKRQKAYFQLLKKYAKEQKDLSEGENDIWIQVGRHDWIALEQQNTVLVKKDLESEFKPKMQVIAEDQTHEQRQQDYGNLAEQIQHDEEDL